MKGLRIALPLLIAIAAVVVMPAAAQTPPASPRTGAATRQRRPAEMAEQAKARYQVTQMERALETAVEHAAREVVLQWQATTPEYAMFGRLAARARGFRLDGYGVFFDVEVPTMMPSLAWSFQIIGPPEDALRSIREHIRSIADPKTKGELEQAMQMLELQFPARPDGRVAAGTAAGQAPTGPPALAAVTDPGDEYTTTVTDTLKDEMLDSSGRLQLGRDEWLTVAARDADTAPAFVQEEPYELITVVLRIRGADLAAFREGRLTRDEARKRIELKEF